MTIIPFPEEGARRGCGRPDPARSRCLQLPVAARPVAGVCVTAEEKPPAPAAEDALAMVDLAMANGITPDLVELTGPGDPLADPEATLAVLEMIHVKHPHLHLGMVTLGLGGARDAQRFSTGGLSQVTVAVDAVDPEVASAIYAWIRPGKKTLPLARAVQCLVQGQAEAIRAFAGAGCKVIVRSTVYPGRNDRHLEEIARRAAALGASAMRIHPGTECGGEQLPPPRQELLAISRRVSRHLPLQEDDHLHTGERERVRFLAASRHGAVALPKPSAQRPNLAAVSSDGMDVDLHLGQAGKILVYGPREDGLSCLLATRQAPEPGGGRTRWEGLAAVLHDCFALLTASAGETPRQILRRHGIRVLVTEGEIEGIVDLLYGGNKGKNRKR